MSFGAPELLVIAFLILLLFGAKRLPGLARSLGQSMREFRKGIQEAGSSASSEVERTPDPDS